MKKLINRLQLLVTAMAMAVCAAAQAQGTEAPIITIHTTAYQEVGPDNKFSIFLGSLQKDYYDIDLGEGLNEVEVEPGYINTSTGDFEGTWIPCRANANGVIKIYGDPLNLNIISIQGAYIKHIDMAQCTNLEVINLQHNVLDALDLTPFTKAFAIYLTDNPFSASTPLKVGTPKPNLAILEIDIVDHLDQSFNLSDYPELVTFDGYHNLDLRNVDPTGCPNLKVLSVEMAPVETLDVSQNPELLRLNISESRIRNIDLSHNPKLEHFLGNHDSGSINTDVKLASIDLSHNPNLTILNLNNNMLGTIDLSKNTKLTNISLDRNALTSLDLSKNTELYSIRVMDNDMDFATLPMPKNSWGEYFYRQNPMQVGRALGAGTVLDLSARVLREGTTTEATVYTMPFDKEPEALDASLYSYADGKLTFNSAMNDSVYVEFSNSTFSEYRLRTTPFMVKDPGQIGKPSLIASMTVSPDIQSNISFAVGIDGASADTPKTFYVDFGNNELKEFQSTFTEVSDAPNVDVPAPEGFNGNVNIYIAENDVMTSFEVTSLPLTGVNVDHATELRRLTLRDCGLFEINMAYNRCLTHLDLSGNKLFALNLTGVYGNYEKFVLKDINASHNNIKKVTLVSAQQIKKLDLSYNKLTEYTLKNHDGLEYLDLSHNQLSGEVSLTYQNGISHVNLSDNNITSLQIDKFTAVENFDIRNNNMTIATLPLPAAIGNGYLYAPQSKIQLLENAPSVNLSEQNRVINGQGTTFSWFKADGTALVEGVDIASSNGGTRFLNEDLGKVYCTMTNPAFPQFTGDNVLKTTEVNVVGAPQNVVATFTTLNDANDGEVIFTGSKKTSLFIDWRGDGTEYIPYPVETHYISYPGQQTFAGATVKVYTYDSADDITVFSIHGMQLADIDVTPLKSLTSLSVCGAGLTADKMKFPETETITEMLIEGNELTSFPFAGRYPNLDYLSMAHNKLTEFDASIVPSLSSGLILSDNELTTVTFNNPKLWNLALDLNKLESVDLNGLPQIEQINLNGNMLSSIDLSPVRNTLKALTLVGNRFTYGTLPLPSDNPRLSVYYYSNQADLEPVCVDGTVDLSAVASAGGNATTYTWFLGEAVLDEENNMYIGETLIPGEEYWLDNGKTIFANTFDEKVMCVMTNATFPSLTMKTKLIGIVESGIDNVAVDNADNELVNVYNLNGVLLKANANRAEATEGLRPGLYIIGGRKVMVK